jgi:demethylmenaquinone methyltransferase/2-methoxy-6-polyprenyl-1,4-benzoquinol methylase
MFGAIAGRYDLMNRLMTGGRDGAWRREAVTLAAVPAGGRALDVGTGTGDFLPLLSRAAPGVFAVGADFTWEMMCAGREKLDPYHHNATFTAADALALPFPDDTFDAVVNGFLLRNVADLRAALAEMVRVARPGGRVVCLEITRPTLPVFRAVFRLYFHRIVPLLGGLISGRPTAYRYLPRSVEGFVSPQELADLLSDVGLRDVRYWRRGLSTVTLHLGVKP